MRSNKITMAVAVLSAVFLSSAASAADVAQQAQNPRPLHVQVAPISNLSEAKLYASSARKALEVAVAGGGAYGADVAASEMDDLLKIQDGATLDAYVGNTVERIKNRIHTALYTGLQTGAGNIALGTDVVLANANGGAYTFGSDDPTAVSLNLAGTAIGTRGVTGFTAGMVPADGSVAALEGAIFAVLDGINTKAKISLFYDGTVGAGDHGAAITHVGVDKANPLALITIANELRQVVDETLTRWTATIWATNPGAAFLTHAPVAVAGTAVPRDAGTGRGKTTALTAGDLIAGQTGNNLIAALLYTATH